MPVSERQGQKIWQRRERSKQLTIWFAWLSGTALFVFCWQLISEQTQWFFVWDAPRIAADIGSRMLPPRWSYITELWEPLWDTINIATLGTMLAIVMAVPVAFLAARNTTPDTRILRPIALLIIVSSRSINSLIWSLLLVSIIGPGVVAGMIAISLRSMDSLPNFYMKRLKRSIPTRLKPLPSLGLVKVR